MTDARARKTGEDFLKMFYDVEQLPMPDDHQKVVILAAMAAFAQYRQANPIGEAAPAQGSAEPPICGKATKYHLIAGASSFACVLDPGHEGECQPGGNCFKHGKYVGATTCPQWPDCIVLPAPPSVPQASPEPCQTFIEGPEINVCDRCGLGVQHHAEAILRASAPEGE